MPSRRRFSSVVGAARRGMLELHGVQRLSDGLRETSSAPRRFVKRLLRLGPLYVKFGQILSTRPDVFPKQYIAALQQLQEHVPQMPFAEVESVVREEFLGNLQNEV